jgi:hypothetical protein
MPSDPALAGKSDHKGKVALLYVQSSINCGIGCFKNYLLFILLSLTAESNVDRPLHMQVVDLSLNRVFSAPVQTLSHGILESTHIYSREVLVIVTRLALANSSANPQN